MPETEGIYDINFSTSAVSDSYAPIDKYSGGSNGGGTSSYMVSISTVSDGTFTVSPTYAKKGDTVTITAKPDEGYMLDTLTVKNNAGDTVTLMKKNEEQYTFVMPSQNVIITGSFKPKDKISEWNNPYSDISDNMWYYDAVKFVTEDGLMSGYTNGTFGPENTVSRAMLAQVLYNKEGRPAVTSSNVFQDVESGSWYYDAVTWAAGKGIVIGYGNDMFGPNDPITRQQLAVMLWRYVGSPSVTEQALDFTDADQVYSWAEEALKWAVQNGIIQGEGNGILNPKGQAKRSHVAQMFTNYIEQ
jgi:hypothetical protein